MKSGTKLRSAKLQAENESRIALLFCKGFSQEAMAQEMGLTRDKIRYSLEKLYERWKTDAVRDFDAAKAKELQKLDYVESQFWEAWDKSKGTISSKSERTFSRRSPGRKGRKRKPAASLNIDRTITTEESAGDARFLEGVLHCIKARRELLGLDPVKDDFTSAPLGATATVIYLPAFSEPLKPPAAIAITSEVRTG